VKSVLAVAFFKEWEPGVYRVSLRSKGEIDIRSVAQQFGGGGHKNAAGCTVAGDLPAVCAQVVPLVLAAIERAAQTNG
jgi:phosphoesterase RecJ-like protein